MLFFLLSLVSAVSFGELQYESLPSPTEWIDSAHGYKLGVRRWTPETTPPKATIVFQHGGGWHSGYFDLTGKVLSEAGYELVMMDMCGHGYSGSPTGKKGHFDLSKASDDLAALVAAQPHPVVLMSESMGALVAAPIVDLADAVVFSGGLFRLHPATAPPGFAKFILKIIGKLFPNKEASLKSLDETFDGAFGDIGWARAARNDPNVLVGKFRVKSFSQVLDAERIALKTKPQLVKSPLLVLHAENDDRTDSQAAVAFHDLAVNIDDKTIILYPDASHQLFQDSEQNIHRVLKDLLLWLDARLGPDANGGDKQDSSTSTSQQQLKEETNDEDEEGVQEEL